MPACNGRDRPCASHSNIRSRENGETSAWSFITRKIVEPQNGRKQMITISKVGALPERPKKWKDINWKQCNRTVTRLQSRIAKATKDERWGKVKSLQWILTHSFSAKSLAVRRITENQGKTTPGIDGQVWSGPTRKLQAIHELKRRGYHAMQALYLMALDPVAETIVDPKSFGFRTQRSTADAIGNCFNALSRKNSAKWILEVDIRSCFDQIDHEWLMKHVPVDKKLLHT